MKDVDDVERSGSYARLLETAWYLGGLGVSFIYSVSSFVSELRVEDCRNQLARLVIIVRRRTISKHAEPNAKASLSMPHLTVQIPWFETMNRFGLVSLVGFWPSASSS